MRMKVYCVREYKRHDYMKMRLYHTDEWREIAGEAVVSPKDVQEFELKERLKNN